MSQPFRKPPADQRLAAKVQGGETRDMFARLDADLFMANQLFRHGLRLPEMALDGTLTGTQRRERIRELILTRRWAERCVIKGSTAYAYLAGQPLGFAFETLYREPLEPPPGSTADEDLQPSA